MKPPASSGFPDRRLGPGRTDRRRVRAGLSAACLLGLALLPGCTDREWPDREPLAVDPAPVDSLEFLPAGSRFVLEDSLTPVLFRFRSGYACTRLTAFGLDLRASADPAGYLPRLALELPPQPDCPLDTGARDSVLLHRFTSADRPVARLFNARGGAPALVMDTASVVRGILSMDSLKLKASADTASRGRFRYRDSTGTLRRQLWADSLPPCEFLNHAEYRRNGDTLAVRFSWVTLDPASPEACGGAARADTIHAIPASR